MESIRPALDAATQAVEAVKSRVTAYLATPESEGYQPVPSSAGYGTIAPTTANGLQSLPADATKIEPKVRCMHPCSSIR